MQAVTAPKEPTGKTYTLEKAFYGDFCEWPEEIEVFISAELAAQIEIARAFMAQNESVRSVTLRPPSDFMSEETHTEMFEACAFDVDGLIVFPNMLFYELQGKYDAHIQAEYSFDT